MQQIEDFLRDGSYSKRPKKVEVKIPATYIHKGAIKKKKKYSDYASSGEYDEIILLCFSDVITPHTSSKLGIIEWTNYFLSEDNFPYDKVIFTSSLSGGDYAGLRQEQSFNEKTFALRTSNSYSDPGKLYPNKCRVQY